MAIVYLPRQMVVDQNGVPRVAAKIYVYTAGTDEFVVLHTTDAYDVEQANPVESQSDGFFPAFHVDPTVYPLIKLVIQDVDGLTIYTKDDIAPEGSSLRTDLAAGTPGLVNFTAIEYPAIAAENGNATNLNFYYGDVRRYGASVTGTAAANKTAIQNAFNTGLPIYGEPADSYSISSGLTFPEAGKLIIRNLKLAPNGAFTCLQRATVTTVATTTLAADVRVGKKTITVTSATGFAIGQRIKLVSTATWLYEATVNRGEVNRIADISGTTVTLAIPTLNDYDVSAETVTITVASLKEVDIDGLDIDFGSATAAIGLGLDSCTGRVRARVRYATSTGIGPVDSFHLILRDCEIDDSYVTGLGYAIQVNSCTAVWASNLKARNNRRAFDTSGGIPSRFCGVDGGMIVGNPAEGSGVGGHQGAVDSFFRNLTIMNTPIGVQLRGPNTVVENILYSSCTTFCTLNRGAGLTLRNISEFRQPNDYNALVGAPDEKDGYFFDLSGGGTLINNDPANEIVIENIKCSPLVAFINVQSDTTAVSRLKIRNVDCIIQNNSAGTAVNAITCGAATTFDTTCRMHDTDIRVRSGHGTFTFFSNVTWNGGLWSNEGYMVGVNAAADPASLADGSGQGISVTCTGAKKGDYAFCSADIDLQGIIIIPEVEPAGTIRVRYMNEVGVGAIDLAAHTLRVSAERRP